MPNTYLVTYDLNKEVSRPKIVSEVKESAGWAKLSESSYAISTNETVNQVHDRFKPDVAPSFYPVLSSFPALDLP